MIVWRRDPTIEVCDPSIKLWTTFAISKESYYGPINMAMGSDCGIMAVSLITNNIVKLLLSCFFIELVLYFC